MTTVPASLGDVVGRVECRVRTLLEPERARWSAVDPSLAEPFEAVLGLVLAGGKRLRPAFIHWGFVGAGGEPGDARSIDAGAAIELLHAFALLHDDVMDGSATRRGAPATHVVLAQRHGGRGWRGEARRFGEGLAVLFGDLAFVQADRLLVDAPTEARAIWNELRVELTVGQFLDLVGTATGERGCAAAERIARYKSAKYTVERPLHLGALLVDAPRRADMLGHYSRYGLPLGDAFQLRDDVLGAFGDADRTGKPVGDDLREGKPTALLAVATERASATEAAVLAGVGRPELDDDDVAAILQVLVDTGALVEVEDRIDRLTGEALDALEDAPIPDEARKGLTELAHVVAWRER